MIGDLKIPAISTVKEVDKGSIENPTSRIAIISKIVDLVNGPQEKVFNMRAKFNEWQDGNLNSFSL